MFHHLKRIVFIISFFVLVSCGGAVKPVVVNGEDIRKIAVSEPANSQALTIEQKTAYTNFMQENRVQPKKDNSGKEIILIGDVELADIKPSAELSKNNNDIQAYLVQLEKFDSSYLNYLKENGYIYGYFIPANAVVVRAKEAGARPQSLKWVKSVTPYQPFMKISSSDGDPAKIRQMKVSLWNSGDAEWFRDYCEKNRILIVSGTEKSFIIAGRDLKKVLFEEKVLRVEKVRDSAVFYYSAKEIGGAVLNSGLNLEIGQGTPARVSVYDVGVDRQHQDLTGVLKNVYDAAGDNDTSEFVPHGTHISGIIAGRGNLSQGKISGVNTEAFIDFFAMSDSLKGLVIPASMEYLFKLSLQNHSYIANLSWGTYDEEFAGKYLSISRDVDEFVQNHPEFIVVAAVGNNGKSIASPSTAKNVISVGAVDGEDLADYSGKNNASDGRVKPELTVQGSGFNSLGLNNSYTVENGTSQAAGLVSGIVSRLYAWVKSAYGILPTHSLVKALLVANTAGDVVRNGYGFGKLLFDSPLDKAHFAVARFKGADSIQNIQVKVKAGDRIVAALSWTEPPAFESSSKQLINDFDLEVTTPSGKIFRLDDTRNNVEKMVLNQTEAGTYTFKVYTKFVLECKDISVVIKSMLGFEPVVASADATNTVLTAQEGQTVDSSSGAQYQFTAPVQTSANDGTQSEGTFQNGNIQIVSSGNVISADVVQAGSMSLTASSGTTEIGLLSLSDLDSSNTTVRNEMLKIYAKAGTNILEARAVGVLSNQVLGIQLNASGITADESVLPVHTDLNAEYNKISLRVENNITADWTNGIAGSVMVKDQESGETNTFPVSYYVDMKAPQLGARYPLEGKTLTNGVAWIEIKDPDSGVDKSMTLMLNGNILGTNQYDYNFGTGRLSFYFDKILSGQNAVPVKISFVKVADSVGNVISNSEWSFTYDLKFDNTAPDKPAGLSCIISNKTFDLKWDANTEKDLWGYRVYLGDKDYLNWKRIDNATLADPRFTFTSKSVSKIGVMALDISSNESEMAVLDADFEYQNLPPSITIENVPVQTNGNVLARITLMDEGMIIKTNIKLDNSEAAVVWNETNGTLNIESDGLHTLYAEVWDDDTNIVTNIVTFTIDKKAPSAPDTVKWEQDMKNIQLSWSEVVKGTNHITYKVYERNALTLEEDILAASNLTETNLLVRIDDYGKFYLSVSAVDDLGNESAKQYVLANTEKGFVLNNTNRYFSLLLGLNADVMISTNVYTNILVELTPAASGTNNRIKQVVEKGHSLSRNIDLSVIENGDYDLTLSVLPAEDHTNIYAYTKRITVDHTPPVIKTLVNGATNEGNYFVLKQNNKVSTVIFDSNYSRARMTYPDTTGIDLLTNIFKLPSNTSMEVSLEAWDKTGNKTSRRVQLVYDNDKPVIEITMINEYVIGRIADANLAGFEVRTNGLKFFESEFEALGGICGAPRLKGELSIIAWDKADNTNVFITNIDNLSDSFTNHIDDILVNGKPDLYFNTSLLSIALVGQIKGGVEYTLFEKGAAAFSSGQVQQTNYLMSGIKDSDYLVRVAASDVSREKELVVDTLKPVITVDPVILQGRQLRDVFTVDDINLEKIRAYLNGTETYLDTRLASGNVELKILAYDYAGNSNTLVRDVYVSEGESNKGEILVDLPDSMVYILDRNGAVQTNTLVKFQTVRHYFPGPMGIKAIGNVTEAKVTVDGSIVSDNKVIMEGDFNINVQAKGENGEGYNAFFGITLDYTVPVIEFAVDNKASRDMPAMKITEKNFSNYIFILDGSRSQTNAAAYEGKHVVEIAALDLAGNSNYFKTDLTIDRTPPSIVCSAKSGEYYSMVPEAFVYDASPVEKNVLMDGVKWETGWLVPDGKHNMIVQAADEAGNSNSLTLSGFYLDGSSPVVTVTPASGFYRQANLGVTVLDGNLKTFLAYLNSKPFNPSAGSILLTNEGTYDVAVYAEDKVGNFTNIRSTLTIDRTDPEIFVGNVLNGMTYLTNLVPDIKVEDRNLLIVTKLLDGAEYNGYAIVSTGGHELSITAEDKAGNKKQIVLNFNIMADSPVIALSGADGVLFEGKILRKDLFHLSAFSDKGTPNGMKVVVNGTEKNAPYSIGTPGEYTVYAKADFTVDGEVIAVASPIYRLVLDTTPPLVGIAGVEEGKYYSNNVKSGGIAMDWVTEWNIALNGHSLGSGVTVRTNDGGYYQFQFAVSPTSGFVLNGNNSLSLSARDALGRETKETVSFKIAKLSNSGGTNDPDFMDDTVKPVIMMSNFYQNMVVSKIASHILIQDQNYRDCELTVNTNGVFYTNIVSSADVIDLSFLNEGPDAIYMVALVANDWAGNYKDDYLNIVLDRMPPFIAVDGYNNGGYFQTANMRLSIGDQNMCKMRVTINSNKKYESMKFNNIDDFDLLMTEDGYYTLLIQAWDTAGNLSQTNQSVVVDNGPPVISVSGVSNGVVYNSDRFITFICRDENLSYYAISNYSTTNSFRDLTYSNVGNMLFSFVFTNDQELYNELCLYAVDRSGNPWYTNINFILDKSAPEVRIDGVVNGGFYNETNKQVYVTVKDNYQLSNATVVLLSNVSGIWETNETTNIISNLTVAYPADGRYRMDIFAIDSIGNSGNYSVEFVIDNVKPVLQITGISNRFNNTNVTVTIDVFDDNVDVNQSRLYVNNYPLPCSSTTSNIHAVTNLSIQDLYAFSIMAQDLAGNYLEYTNALYIDKTAPFVSVEGTNGKYFNTVEFVVNSGDYRTNRGWTGLQRLEWDIISNGIIMSQYSNDLTFINQDKSIHLLFSSWVDGVYQIVTRAYDWAGNGATNGRSFVIDTHPPVVNVFKDDGITGVTNLTSTNIADTTVLQDVTYAMIFKIISSINDVNNIKLFRIFSIDMNGNTNNFPGWSNEDDTINNKQVTNTASSFYTIKAAKEKIVIEAYDFAGNRSQTGIVCGYWNSTPPTVVYTIMSNRPWENDSQGHGNIVSGKNDYVTVAHITNMIDISNVVIKTDDDEYTISCGSDVLYLSNEARYIVTGPNGEERNRHVSVSVMDILGSQNTNENMVYWIDKKPPSITITETTCWWTGTFPFDTRYQPNKLQVVDNLSRIAYPYTVTYGTPDYGISWNELINTGEITPIFRWNRRCYWVIILFLPIAIPFSVDRYPPGIFECTVEDIWGNQGHELRPIYFHE